MFKDKKCPHCGKTIRNKAVFCLDCGRSVDGQESYIGNSANDFHLEGCVAEKIGSPPFLRVIKGPDLDAVIELGKKIIIGRLRESDNVVLSDPYISRQHLSITDIGGQYRLKNISKTNGTKVNGEEVDSRLLQDGDVIEIGYTVMVLESPG